MKIIVVATGIASLAWFERQARQKDERFACMMKGRWGVRGASWTNIY